MVIRLAPPAGSVNLGVMAGTAPSRRDGRRHGVVVDDDEGIGASRCTPTRVLRD